LNFVFGGLLVIASSEKDSGRRCCGNGGKAGAVFAQAFPNSLWESSRRSAEGHLSRFPQLWPFPQHVFARRFLFGAWYLKKKKAPGCRLEPKTRVINGLYSGANQ
jgi:hypothetical protein